MKWTLWLAPVLLGACAAQGGTPVEPAAYTQPALRNFPAIHAFAEAVVRDGKAPGITIAIGMGDAPPVFITAGKMGFAADQPPVGEDSLWRIYSMTKPITGIAAMILIDDGKLRLDQPVSDFFPEFAQARVLIDPANSLETRPASRTITLRDLMTHASGLNYAVARLETPARKQLAEWGVTPLQVSKGVEAQLRPLRPSSLREFARRAGKSPLVADPGSQWTYSMGLDVLAAVVEEASGVPYHTFLDKRLFRPLGMTSTWWRVPASQAGRLVANYGVRTTVDALWPGTLAPVSDVLTLVDPGGAASVYLTAPSFPYGGAGLVSSARDYDRFLQMLLDDGALNGKQILKRVTARLARSNLLPAGVFSPDASPLAPGQQGGFGAGGFVTLREVDSLGRRKGSYGWSGAAGTRAWVDPVRKVRATMMINVIGAASLGDEFDKAVASDLK